MSVVPVIIVGMDVDRGVAAVAAGQHGLITRAQAVARGMSFAMCDRRVATGAWERVHRCVYRLAGAPKTWEQSLLAACLAIPGSTASHRAAAALWELPGIDRRLELTVLEFHKVRLDGVEVHRPSHLPSGDRVWRSRIPVTSLSRTLIDLAGVVDPGRLAAALDHALAHRRVSLPLLSKKLETLGTRGRRGTAVLADLIAEREGRARHADSEPQRRLGEVLGAAGLPAPEVEYPVHLSEGRMAYIDAAFPSALLAVEVDSYAHHSTVPDWARDRSRNNELIALGWRVLSVTPHDLETDPSGVADQVARALAAMPSQP